MEFPIQHSWKTVADFVRRLERMFQVAYGWDKLKTETGDTLLYGQLMEEGPSVLGSQTYKELCTATKSEERQLAALRKRLQYDKLTLPKLATHLLPLVVVQAGNQDGLCLPLQFQPALADHHQHRKAGEATPAEKLDTWSVTVGSKRQKVDAQ